MPPRLAPSIVAASLILTPLLTAADKPNILWLSAEDHGPHLGCYGDDYADTPNVDAFAKRSLLYTHAISSAPVCSPGRTTIITGMYAPALGAQHMRSEVRRPAWLKFFPEYLREAGYYCSNNSKTDYNVAHDLKAVWDESSGKAHYSKRRDGQPFFAVFNFGGTHESKIRKPDAKPVHDPAKVSVPPYHPDLPEVRNNWAQYYDRITTMDKWFAGQLKALEEAGLSEDTIVFFWADHGSGMPRGKRYAGWSGVHVPLIVHIPEKWKHLRPEEYQAGGKSNRLVGFVDFGVTILALAGLEPAPYHQGHAFLGRDPGKAPAYSYGFRGRMDERPDCSRSVIDGRYLYLRNFMPHLPHGQDLQYQLRTQTTRAWRELYHAGKLNKVQAAFWKSRPPEELYDLEVDPHETNNLAGSSEHADKLKEMRRALATHLAQRRDLALLPEGLLHDRAEMAGLTPGDMARDTKHYPVAKILAATDLLLAEELSVDKVTSFLRSEEAACRYWAALGCLHLGEHAFHQLAGELEKLLADPSPAVQIAAAHAVATYPVDEEKREEAMKALHRNADPTKTSAYHAVAALNAIDKLPYLPAQLKKQTLALPTNDPDAPTRANGYAERMHKHLAGEALAEGTKTKKRK